jgi:hypothetical protein
MSREPREEPLHESKASAKNLWQNYRIFADRIELDLHVIGTIRVPFEAIERVVRRPPLVICDVFRGDYGLGELMRTPKLDLADLAEHVAIEKDGFWKQFRITPDDPKAFIKAFEDAHAAWESSRSA